MLSGAKNSLGGHRAGDRAEQAVAVLRAVAQRREQLLHQRRRRLQAREVERARKPSADCSLRRRS